MNIHVDQLNEADAMAMLEAVRLSNQATQALGRGDYASAEALHRQALQIKERIWGSEDTRPAISMNGLGEALLRQGKLDEAEVVFQRALRVLTNKCSQSFDTAYTRENIAQLYEAKGDLQAAKAIRLEGLPNNLACSNGDCGPVAFPLDQLFQCSRCSCPFYCSERCQSADWERHRKFCSAQAAL